jgi:hypothetical protein
MPWADSASNLSSGSGVTAGRLSVLKCLFTGNVFSAGGNSMRKLLVVRVLVTLFAGSALAVGPVVGWENSTDDRTCGPGWLMRRDFQASPAVPFTSRAKLKPDVSKIYGKIMYVDSFPDYKVQIVSSFPDLRVQVVNSFPDKAGKWKIVSSFPDYKIQIVNSFPDFRVQYVKSFPGIP